MRLLSQVQDACQLQLQPQALVTVLQAPKRPSSGEDAEFVTAVRKALREGTSVVVKGWHPSVLLQFTIESFEMAGFSGDQTVVCHSELLFPSAISNRC